MRRMKRRRKDGLELHVMCTKELAILLPPSASSKNQHLLYSSRDGTKIFPRAGLRAEIFDKFWAVVKEARGNVFL